MYFAYERTCILRHSSIFDELYVILYYNIVSGCHEEKTDDYGRCRVHLFESLSELVNPGYDASQ